MGLPNTMLTNSELLVNHTPKEVKNDPFISTLGVKMVLNSVNMTKIPLYFHSRHEFGQVSYWLWGCLVKVWKALPRGLGSEC